jgi:hypothetical protein
MFRRTVASGCLFFWGVLVGLTAPARADWSWLDPTWSVEVTNFPSPPFTPPWLDWGTGTSGADGVSLSAEARASYELRTGPGADGRGAQVVVTRAFRLTGTEMMTLTGSLVGSVDLLTAGGIPGSRSASYNFLAEIDGTSVSESRTEIFGTSASTSEHAGVDVSYSVGGLLVPGDYVVRGRLGVLASQSSGPTRAFIRLTGTLNLLPPSAVPEPGAFLSLVLGATLLSVGHRSLGRARGVGDRPASA